MKNKKVFGFVGFMVILPLLPYVHIFFKDNLVLWNYVKNIKFLKPQVLYFENLANIIYYPLYFISISLLFYLLYKTSSTRLKVYFLFPMYLAFTKLLGYLFPYFTGDYWYASYPILIIPFAFVFCKNYKHLSRVKSEKSNNLFFENFSAILLISLPFLYESYRLFPDNTEVIHILFFKISANGFNNARSALYAILQKVSFLIPFCIYFVAQKKWTKYAVLFPILIYSAQLVNILNPELTTLDEIEVFQTLPYTLPLLFALFLSSKANENQEKIGYWLASQYKLVENSLISKFSDKEVFINDKRKELAKSKLKIEDLEKIKTELEQELKSSK